ncbi:hypothetical protein NDU88_006207 [Pleurodeles waltl]|uniref:Uncharacterized protein n=1 Tax=Pleurodeles waltl TaxID=8319 RepID=A0AAV7NSE6_PLEWA|nr:hypothetical protein NDU88_006207 [Pleurodeles waltl]
MQLGPYLGSTAPFARAAPMGSQPSRCVVWETGPLQRDVKRSECCVVMEEGGVVEQWRHVVSKEEAKDINKPEELEMAVASQETGTATAIAEYRED